MVLLLLYLLYILIKVSLGEALKPRLLLVVRLATLHGCCYGKVL